MTLVSTKPEQCTCVEGTNKYKRLLGLPNKNQYLGTVDGVAERWNINSCPIVTNHGYQNIALLLVLLAKCAIKVQSA